MQQPTPSQVAHFSINADDVARARHFYETVFGWTFHAYGPPGFYMIETTPASAIAAPILGSLQGRRELVDGIRMTGFECTIAVEDIDETIRLIEQVGGKIVMPKCTLPSIGHLCFFQDPEGNLVGAMQYDFNAN
ncbi:MAG: VOC family protein [Fimbriimonas sp.]|nr:VOC family protein [Fimbriimonas sp.]